MPDVSRRAGPAILFSLLAHGLVAIALNCVSVPAAELPQDSRVEESPATVSLTLMDLPVLAHPGPASGSSEEQEHDTESDFRVVVRDTAEVSAADAAISAPVVVGLPRPVRSGVPAAATATGARSSLLEAPRSARRVVYLLDRSLSMGLNGALRRAREELLAAVASLPSEASFEVILYNSAAEPLTLNGEPGFHFADPATRRALAEQLERIVAAGTTDHTRALRRGLLLHPDVLFLVTDADDLSVGDVLDVSRQNAGNTVIHAVELTRHRGERDSPLRQLAKLNGGSYRCLAPGE